MPRKSKRDELALATCRGVAKGLEEACFILRDMWEREPRLAEALQRGEAKIRAAHRNAMRAVQNTNDPETCAHPQGVI